VEAELHTFLTSAPNVGKWSASCPSCFIPRKRVSQLGGWMDPRAGVDVVVKRKIPVSPLN